MKKIKSLKIKISNLECLHCESDEGMILQVQQETIPSYTRLVFKCGNKNCGAILPLESVWLSSDYKILK